MSVQTLNVSIQLSGLVLCAVGILHVLLGPRYVTPRRYFFWFFICLFLYNISNLLGQFFRGFPGWRWRLFLHVVNFGEFMYPLVLLYFVTIYLTSLVDPLGENKAPLRIQFAFLAVDFALLVVNLLVGFIYYFDENNIYHRGTFYLLSYVVPLLMITLNIYLLRTGKDKLTTQEKRAFMAYAIFPLAAMLIQPFIYGIYVVVFATVLSAGAMYIFLRWDETERYYDQEKENANLKINIMLSQIQPHFIYNSLFVIQQMCMTDAEAAGKSIGKFTQYLRHNMDSITIDTPIPFEEELRHVQCYVELQQLRFGDRLHIEYDLPCRNFHLPTLTLQPIVENAVTYGVRKTANGEGTVRVISREKPDCYEITVQDNGPGFVPETLAGQKERARVGLRNVKERLERICGGKLVIETKLGEGTSVTLVIPKKRPVERRMRHGVLDVRI